MKVILEKESPKEEILVGDITDCHIVCAVISNNPCILGKGYYEADERLNFFKIGGDQGAIITRGNGYFSGSDKDSIKTVVTTAISCGHKVEVFESNKWVEALQWLIDNTPKP